MIVPVRCFTCGRLIADKWHEYSRRVRQGEDSRKVLDELGMKRYCCRRMMISHVEIIDEFLSYAELAHKKRAQMAWGQSP